MVRYCVVGYTTSLNLVQLYLKKTGKNTSILIMRVFLRALVNYGDLWLLLVETQNNQKPLHTFDIKVRQSIFGKRNSTAHVKLCEFQPSELM